MTTRCHYFAGSLLPNLCDIHICSAHSTLLSNQRLRSFVVVRTLTAELNNLVCKATDLNNKVNPAIFNLIFFVVNIYVYVQLFNYLYCTIVWITIPLTQKLNGGLMSKALVSH